MSGRTERMRVAIVGSGISGAAAAWVLNKVHDVTLFEQSKVPGGHTATIDIDYDGTAIAVDTGFIVYNELNYPLLTRLFSHLGVETTSSEMSFALSRDGGRLEWSGQSYASLFAQKRNLASPGFLWMLREVLRFNKTCVADRDSGFLNGKSIEDYLAARAYSQRFRDDYLIPMSAAIWSTSRERMLDFPAATLVSFFENHRLIHQDRPQWRTVAGGSRNYLDKLLKPLGERLRLDCPVTSVRRLEDHVLVAAASGAEAFDKVIFAGHSDQTLAILADPSREELRLLSAVKYQPNRVILHRDGSFMPKRRSIWSAWNYLSSSKNGGEPEISMTYWMNRLQGIDQSRPLFITLNPDREPTPGTVFGEWSYAHPQFDGAALRAQKELPLIQGVSHSWFAGAWTGYGFHEDGLRSGLEAAQALGAPIPWESLSARPEAKHEAMA